MALTQIDLDQMRCSKPGCDHTAHDGPLVFHSHCHSGVPTWVTYDNGVLTVACAQCEQIVCQVEVAAASQE